MTKEQFLKKWVVISVVKDMMLPDLDAVIAAEIAKAQPEKTNKIEITPHTLVEINRAFRALKQDRNSYIHKVFSDDGVFDAMEEIRKMFEAIFVEKSTEQVTEPNEQPAQPSSQVILDNSFDRDRFEAMFRAVVASGVVNGITYDESILQTKLYLTQLDSYYAKKKGGSNG